MEAVGPKGEYVPNISFKVNSEELAPGPGLETRITSSKGWRATDCTTPE